MSESRSRICFVAPYAYPILAADGNGKFAGGAEVQQVIVARGLAERGYKVSMICLDFGQRDRAEIADIRVLKAYNTDQGIPGLRAFWPRLTSIWQCMAAADADIYYQRVADRLTGIVAAFCKLHGRKSVFAAAGNPDLEKPTPRVPRSWDRWVYEYGLRHVDRILVQNRQQVLLCRSNFGRDPIHVPNCYPIPSESSGDSGRYVLWVSMIRRVKRPEIFLDLAEALPGCEFRMVGGPDIADPEYYKVVQARARKIKNLDFKGFVPYPEVDKYFDDAVCFVNTSESEGFPNTFLQAWSRKVQTVSFINCGSELEGEPVGKIVQSFNEMVSAVRGLVESEPFRVSAGKRVRKYFDMTHNPRLVIDKYEKIFSDMIATKKR